MYTTPKNTVRARMLIAALFAAFVTTLVFWAPLIVLFGCAEQSVVDSAADQTGKAVEQARKHMTTVAEVLDAAAPAIKEAPGFNWALADFREAYDSGENAEALGHLRTALDGAIKAGLEVPDEVPERMGQAQLLLELVGQ